MCQPARATHVGEVQPCLARADEGLNSLVQGVSRRRLDGCGAAARRELPTFPLRGLAGAPAPRPGWRSPQPICPARGATNTHGVGTSTSLDRKPDGGGDRPRQPEPSVWPRAGEQGCSRRGRPDRRRTGDLDRRAQGHVHRCAAGRGRGATIGHPDGGGSSGSASHPASAGETTGPDVLGVKLRLPAGTRGPRRAGASQPLRGRGSAYRGRSRSGEVLRPGQP